METQVGSENGTAPSETVSEEPWGIEAIISEATPQERSIRICVKGDLRERYRELERQLDAASDGRDVKDDPTPVMSSLARQLEEARSEIERHMRRFTFRSIGPNWQTIRKKYANEQNEVGDFAPYGAELFAAAAVKPEMSVDQARRLIERLSEGDISKLFETATLANFETTAEVPKSRLASRILEGGSSVKS